MSRYTTIQLVLSYFIVIASAFVLTQFLDEMSEGLNLSTWIANLVLWSGIGLFKVTQKFSDYF